ncbi:radical SAM protein [Roseburia hominis]
MYISENNIYISDENNILFDLNGYRIFVITDGIRGYFEDGKADLLSDDEKGIVEQILAEDKIEAGKEEGFESIKIHVSNTCNLQCKYCYANGGNYRAKDSLMDLNTAKKVVEFINTSDRLNNLKYISFFGGEPLMNPQIIEYICEHTQEKNVDYLLQTNGTLLDDYIIQILKKYNIVLTISLDGPEHMNDFNRIDMAGKGTYNRIVDNIQRLKSAGIVPKAIEATISSEFIDKYSKLQIADYIYETTGVRLIKVEYDMNAPQKKDINKESAEEVHDFYAQCLAGKYIMDNAAYKILQIFFARQYNDYVCPAGSSLLTVNVNGELYPCQFFIEDSSWKKGDVFSGFVENRECAYRKTNREKCRGCSARSTCCMCVASDIKEEDRCKKNILIQGMTLEALADCIKMGEFDSLYQNFCSL